MFSLFAAWEIQFPTPFVLEEFKQSPKEMSDLVSLAVHTQEWFMPIPLAPACKRQHGPADEAPPTPLEWTRAREREQNTCLMLKKLCSLENKKFSQIFSSRGNYWTGEGSKKRNRLSKGE